MMATISFVLISLIGFGIYMYSKKESIKLYLPLIIIPSILLTMHVSAYFYASYKYEIFISKRNALIESVVMETDDYNAMEKALLTDRIIDVNIERDVFIAHNKMFLIGCYINDDVENTNYYYNRE